MDLTEVNRVITEQMKTADLNDRVIGEFLRRVEMVAGGFSGKIPWNEIHDPEKDDLIRLEDLHTRRDPSDLLRNLAVIKLNGGLGTSMGLSEAKSLIPVKGNNNFLYYMRKQIEHLRSKYSVGLPLVFMNSFNTSEDTLNEPGIRQFNQEAGLSIPVDFLQNMVPRIRTDTLLPAGNGQSPSHWCPPGHGDIYLAMDITGVLDRLLDHGFRIAFISNSDNLAAEVSLPILSHMLEENLDFMMEITPKTLADIKGGVLIRRKTGGDSRVELLEAAQVEEDHMEDFKNVERFSYFNTNNLWVNLESLRDRLRSGGLPLSVIVNPKNVDGTDVYQLETAMGSAIGHFASARGVIIPRNRFAPVKNNQDLLVRRSDVYQVHPETFTLVRQSANEPVVRLDDKYYKKIDGFNSLFKEIPSLKEVLEFTVEGPVLFDRPITVKGKVTIKNHSEKPVSIGNANRDVFEDETVEIGSV